LATESGLSVRRILGIGVSAVAFALLVLLAVVAAERMQARPRTNDAYLQADLVHMAPDVSGRIVEFDVQDNQLVRRGQVLFSIDPGPYRLRVEQAAANVRALQATIDVTANRVASQTSKAGVANKGISSAEAQLALATSTFHRLEPLLARGFVTAQQVDQARTSEKTAQVALDQARQQAVEAQQGISSVKPDEEALVASKATLALAERDLRLTTVRSPCDGRIAGLDIATGEFATTGVPLFTIIDTEHWYAVGNFRETDLAGIHPGEAAQVYVMMAPDQPVTGRVDSVGWGVAPDEGATLGGLPDVPRSLNWVRIAQRFPIRILLTSPRAELMRLGASASIVIGRQAPGP
jgi:multidrug efflux system membrane fusion protein